MNRIQLLPENIANQIAAGEVVERPSSVVKELVENALDAGARRVQVEVQSGGRSLVRVTDDGTGMSRDDALLCLERHATSKIQKAEDLASIRTMGFRGEALPSIASVSRFVLTTRERDAESPEGSQILVHGGKLLDVKAAGHAPGTTVEVRNLFFNLPARRKFLRSEETERSHIQQYLTLAALAHPEVGFTLIQNQKTHWNLPPISEGGGSKSCFEKLRERMNQLHGRETQWLNVESATRYSALDPDEDLGHPRPSRQVDLKLWGLTGAPGVARSTRESQHLFVNRRPIDNKGLNFALLEGYHTALMKGRYPVCCLFIEIDPSEIDVNIHPAKREIKFHQERRVRRQVSQTIRETLLRYHQPSLPASQPGSDWEPETRGAVVPPAADSREATAQATGGIAPPPPSENEWAAPEAASPPTPPDPPQVNAPLETAAAPEPELFESGRTDDAPKPGAVHPSPQTPVVSSPKEPAPLLSVPLRLVGVIGRLYVVLESDRGMVLLDQHAAHERILYEQMMARMESQSVPSQKLLLPETVELSPNDARFLKEQIQTLQRMGVGVSEFGDRTFLLDSLPPFVKTGNARRFVLELVDELKAAGEEVNSMRLGENVVAKTVCRHAVKANDPLREPELLKLVEDLRRCAMPYTCPHGRPTMVETPFRELEKNFGRIA